MSGTTEAVAGHAPNLFARWSVDNFPRFQVSCECGWKTATEDSEQAATASHAEHARQPVGSPTWNPMRQAYDRPPTLADFLLARIAEDEELAQQAAAKPWRLDGGFSITVDAGSVLAVGQHMMRWDPARVLAECEAKRKIVELSVEYLAPDASPWYAEQVLLLLAEPYADHPEFREEWRV